ALSPPSTQTSAAAPSRRPRGAARSACCSPPPPPERERPGCVGVDCSAPVLSSNWDATAVRGADGRSDDLSRQQELLLLVAARLARAEAHHRRLRRGGDPARSADQPRDDPQILALGAGPGAQAWRADGV